MVKRRLQGTTATPRGQTSNLASGYDHWFYWLRPAAAFLVAVLVVWSMLVPADATSVFEGQALAQNLFWLIAACLSAWAVVGHGGFRFGRGEWLVCSLLLLGIVAVSIHAGIENGPRRGWNGAWQVIAIGACYFCCRSLVVGPRTRAMLVGFVLWGCVASSLHGIHQIWIGFPAARAQYQSDPEGELAKIPGLYAPPGSPQRLRFESRLESPEPYASFALANSLATLLSAGLVLVGGMLLQRLTTRGLKLQREHLRSLGGLIIATLAMLFTWFLTLSRTAYLVVTLTFVVTLLLQWRYSSGWKTYRTYLLYAVTGLACMLAAGLFWISRNDQLVLSEAGKSLGYRLEYWQATWQMIVEHSLTGVGLGNFQNYYPAYKLITASEEIADPHNWVLDIGATLGVPILLLAIVGLGTIFSRGLWGGDSEEESHASPTLTPVDDLDRVSERALGAGALVGGGFVLALLFLLMNYEIGVALLSWVPALVLVRAMWPVVMDFTSRPNMCILLSAGAMLGCLLASGSWQASGLAIPAAVLCACARRYEHGRQLSVKHLVVALPALGLLIFLFQAWLPVTRAWALSQQASFAASQSEQVRLAEAASQADRLDADLLGFVAQGQAAIALSGGRGEFPQTSRTAIRALDHWVQRDQIRFNNWRQAGNLALDLCKTAELLGYDSSELSETSIGYYQAAVARYPTSAELRLQLAAAHAFRQNWQASEEQIRRAELISQATPHADKQLAQQLIWYPFAGLPADTRSGVPGMVKAEPLIEWIRSKSVLAVPKAESAPIP